MTDPNNHILMATNYLILEFAVEYIYMQSCNVSQCDSDALRSLTMCQTPCTDPETQKEYSEYILNILDTVVFVNLL